MMVLLDDWAQIGESRQSNREPSLAFQPSDKVMSTVDPRFRKRHGGFWQKMPMARAEANQQHDAPSSIVRVTSVSFLKTAIASD